MCSAVMPLSLHIPATSWAANMAAYGEALQEKEDTAKKQTNMNTCIYLFRVKYQLQEVPRRIKTAQEKSLVNLFNFEAIRKILHVQIHISKTFQQLLIMKWAGYCKLIPHFDSHMMIKKKTVVVYEITCEELISEGLRPCLHHNADRRK